MSVVKNIFVRLYRSVWLFPVIMSIPLITLTGLQISGSSVGVLHGLFYGGSKDNNLVSGTPQSIRSDEWLVNTQTTVGQSKSGYPRVNEDIGNGEDVSLNSGVPYGGWSEIFRPQNLAYFVLALPNAFAFQWWIIGYLLIISCYFFVLSVLPRKRLLAALLALSLFFSAFLQWWYEYGTLASIYYSLFIATAVVHLSRTKKLINRLLIGSLIVYLLVCFALVLYPPFQIACGLGLIAFLVGYFWQYYPRFGKSNIVHLTGVLAVCSVLALAIVGTFVLTRSDVVRTMSNTSYPGQRAAQSGTYSKTLFLSSQLGYQFTSPDHAAQYRLDGAVVNQSEASNFLLLSPLLVMPVLLILYKDWRNNRRLDKLLFVLTLCLALFSLHLFLPAFSPIAKFFLLDKVPPSRLLIGVGLLDIFLLISFVRRSLAKENLWWFSGRLSLIYALCAFAFELIINVHVHANFGTFVGIYRAIAFALPLPIIIYLLLRKRFVLAAALYLAFSIFISFKVNPLYRGLDIITNNPVSKAMVQITGNSRKLWVTDTVITENLAISNGLRSLSGVYYYPQNELWNQIPGANYTDYNRYAHVTFDFTKQETTPPKLSLASSDQVRITTGICSDYLKQKDVGFALALQQLSGSCVEEIVPIKTPSMTFYAYKLNL